MIFFAVAAPTPGSASSCAWVEVFRSTGPPRGIESRAARDAPGGGIWVPARRSAADAARGDAMAFPLAVTLPDIVLIAPAETPARLRSATEAYGRPAMIFLAVAVPTPGSASSCA